MLQMGGWQVKPQLIVCSPMTRAIQTAAVLFEEERGRSSPSIRAFLRVRVVQGADDAGA